MQQVKYVVYRSAVLKKMELDIVPFISQHFIFQNIKLSSMRTKAAEDLADEGDAAGAAIVQARNKFLTQVIYHLSNVTQMIWERNAISSVSSFSLGYFSHTTLVQHNVIC